MPNYRLQPRLEVLDEDKMWTVIDDADKVVFQGSYNECLDYYKKHKEHKMEEKTNE